MEPLTETRTVGRIPYRIPFLTATVPYLTELQSVTRSVPQPFNGSVPLAEFRAETIPCRKCFVLKNLAPYWKRVVQKSKSVPLAKFRSVPQTLRTINRIQYR